MPLFDSDRNCYQLARQKGTERSSAKQMKVGVEYLLAAVSAYVCNKAPAIRSDSLLRSQVSGYLDNPPQNLGLGVTHFSQIIEVLIGDDQYVNWRLCRNILKSGYHFVLVELLRGYFPGNDFAENTVLAHWRPRPNLRFTLSILSCMLCSRSQRVPTFRLVEIRGAPIS